jgi:hypothetical protein
MGSAVPHATFAAPPIAPVCARDLLGPTRDTPCYKDGNRSRPRSDADPPNRPTFRNSASASLRRGNSLPPYRLLANGGS